MKQTNNKGNMYRHLRVTKQTLKTFALPCGRKTTQHHHQNNFSGAGHRPLPWKGMNMETEHCLYFLVFCLVSKQNLVEDLDIFVLLCSKVLISKYIPVFEKYVQQSFKPKDRQARNFFFHWLAQYCFITCLTWKIIRQIIAAPSPESICVIFVIWLSYTDSGSENLGARQKSIINLFMFPQAIWPPSQLF